MSRIVDLPHSIALEGVSNLRDLGGWSTRDGGTVKRGQVFRSAALHALTEKDIAALRTLVDEPQPLGIDRAAYRDALLAIERAGGWE